MHFECTSPAKYRISPTARNPMKMNMESFPLQNAQWFCPPRQHEVTERSVWMMTGPYTDLWQRTYYGFQHDNAHFLYHETDDISFTFTVKCRFNYKTLFDQCGIAVYLDSDNWFKACIEFHDEQAAWLGSVVTKNGYSDWASLEISGDNETAWYRLSRRNTDYLIEYSPDGTNFKQMRIFHFGEEGRKIKMGLMAASPGNSSFEAFFFDITVTPCLWKDHSS